MTYINLRKNHRHLPFLLLALTEFVVLFSSVYIVKIIQIFLNISPQSSPSSDPLVALIYAVLLSCGSLAMGVYLAMMRDGFMAMFFRTLVAYCFLGLLSLSLLSSLWPFFDLGGGNLFWIIIVSTALTFSTRRIFNRFITSERRSFRILVLGTDASARQLQIDCEQHRRSLNLRVVAYLGSAQAAIAPTQCVAVPEDLLRYCIDQRIAEIIVAQQERRRTDGSDFLMNELIRCKLHGIEVTHALSFYERELHRVKLDLLAPSWIVFANGFPVSRLRALVKRLFDLGICLALALVLVPFVAIAALLVFFETGRPILYSQIRVGKDGRSFKMYKLRSMRQDAEPGGNAVWAKANDARITKVGHCLRNTRLDEIPQLWNVLRGEMSFVGPRPERPEFVAQLNEKIPFYVHRHTVKPGLMGWAQLNYPYGASVADAQAKLEYDLYYSKNHSLLMDLLIAIQTVEVLLLGKGVR